LLQYDSLLSNPWYFTLATVTWSYSLHIPVHSHDTTRDHKRKFVPDEVRINKNSIYYKTS